MTDPDVSMLPSSALRRSLPASYLAHHPIVVVAADGPYVTDEDGRRYIDLAGGIGVMNLGHRAPEVIEAVRAQVDRVLHTGPVTLHRPYLELAARLARLVPGPERQVLLLSSGAEAVENAVKLARHATGRPAIVAFERSFHGRTLLTSSLNGKSLPYKSQPGALAPEIHHIPYPYPLRPPRGVAPADVVEHALWSLDHLLETRVPAEKVAAVIVEPVQGEGGYIVPPRGFLRALAERCRERSILLIVDEIQTGFGRTGRFFAFEHEGIEPDVIVAGKSIAAGLPLAAVIAPATLWDRVYPGDVGGTYGGNPVACAAALAVLDVFDSRPVLDRAVEIGDITMRALRPLGSLEKVAEVRGIGPMIAIEIVADRRTLTPDPLATQRVLEAAREKGLLLIKTGMHGNVIRVLPPLVIDDTTLARGLAILGDAAHEALGDHPSVTTGAVAAVGTPADTR